MKDVLLVVELVGRNGDLRANRVFVCIHESFVLVVLKQDCVILHREPFTFDVFNQRL